MPAKKIFQILLKEARYSQLIPGLRQQALQIKLYACAGIM